MYFYLTRRHTPSSQIEFWDRLLIYIFFERNTMKVYYTFKSTVCQIQWNLRYKTSRYKNPSIIRHSFFKRKVLFHATNCIKSPLLYDPYFSDIEGSYTRGSTVFATDLYDLNLQFPGSIVKLLCQNHTLFVCLLQFV